MSVFLIVGPKCTLLSLFFYLFRFCAVRQINLAISSAFERTLIYRIVSYLAASHAAPGKSR